MRIQGIKRWQKYSLLAVLIIVVIGWISVPTIRRARESLRGNYPIAFYGRIADAQGIGISGAEIEFTIAYSERAQGPGMFGRQELLHKINVVSDRAGNFELTGAFGYKIAITSLQWQGKKLDWAFGARDPRNHYLSYSYTERVSAGSIPSTPSRRITYYLRPRDSP